MRSARSGGSILSILETYKARHRRQLAREMHDDFGQLLAAMKMNLTLLESETAAHVTARDHVQHLQQLVDAMMSSVRRVIAEQPPQILEEHGLAQAVAQLVHDFRMRHTIQFKLEMSFRRETLPMSVQQAVYRILQEALNNCVRHARARTVRIILAGQDGRIIVEISDDGCGGAAVDLRKPDSVGLAWMHDRVASFGGEMRVDSAAATGTTLSIAIPTYRQRSA